MARFTVVFAALLLLTGSVIADDFGLDNDDFDPSNNETTTVPDTTTSSTTTTTTTTTSATTTPTTTTTPETTTPTTTTTTTPTTTPANTTTTTAPSTTTPTPTTTTEPPKPTSHIDYKITEDNVTCVRVAGDIFFNINYSRSDNTTVIGKVFVPSLGVDVSGSCNDSGNQYISFTWGKNVVQMNFSPADKDSWTFTDLIATLSMADLDNATETGTLKLTVDYNFNPGEVSFDHSFICRADLSTSNVTAMLNDKPYDPAVSSTLKNIQIQAFNTIANEKDFVDSVHCTADNISDVVPIAVGCALAGLVVIVLIAYLVGRRRRSGAYQSV